MQFIDLKSQYSLLKKDIDSRIQKVLDHGQYIMGPEVFELEERLAAYCGMRFAITCSSGTDALLMVLMARGIGPGDAVFTSPFTFFATAEVIALLGATPVFVDIHPDTFNLDVDSLESAISALIACDPQAYPLPRLPQQQLAQLTPRAILAVDIFGLPANYHGINAIARKYGLCVIEDAAQSFGAQYKGRRACALGDVGCTSFFPAKPLGAYGDGGAIFTNDSEIAELLCSIRAHGQGDDRYEHVRLGLTGRLDTIQAAILLAKLGNFDVELAKRQMIANMYDHFISDRGELQTSKTPHDSLSAWAQYSVLARDASHRDACLSRLSSEAVPHAIYYRTPVHLQKGLSQLGYAPGTMPICEDICRRIFALPMHPYLTSEKVEQVVTAMHS